MCFLDGKNSHVSNKCQSMGSTYLVQTGQNLFNVVFERPFTRLMLDTEITFIYSNNSSEVSKLNIVCT